VLLVDMLDWHLADLNLSLQHVLTRMLSLVTCTLGGVTLNVSRMLVA